MKTLKSSLTILLMFVAYNLSAIDYEWAGRYNGGGVDRGLHAYTDHTGKAYLAGVSTFPGGSKIVTSTYSVDGVLLSLDVANTFLSNDNVKQIERDDSRNIYVLCQNAVSSFTLIKYNKHANEKWRKNYANYVVGFEVGNSNDIYINYLTPAGATVRRLKKANGSTDWTRNIADVHVRTNSFLSDFTIDKNDNTYFGGTTETPASADDYRIVKIKKNGDIIYNHRYSTPGADDEEVFKIETNDAGQLYIVGDYDQSIPSRTNFHMVKFNSAGNFLWATVYDFSGPTSVYFPTDIEVGPDGHPVAVGTDNDFFNINPAGEVRRILVSKFNSATGAIIFSVFPNDPSNTADDLRETAVTMTIDSHNNIFFGGISNVYAGIAVAPDRFMIAKVNGATGNLQWVDASTSFNDPANQVNDITVTDDDFVYMAATENLGATVDMALIKYCQVDCFLARNGSGDLNDISLNIFPNPSAGSFTLQTSSSNDKPTEISVFGINGNLIFSGNISTEEYQFGIEYTAGIYIVRLTNPSYSRTLRIVKTD